MRVRIAAERRVDRAVALAERGGAVDVDRRALGVGDRRQRHAVADELVGAVSGEAGHGGCAT